VEQLDRADPIGKQAIMPEPLEAAGQDMEEKPAEEFDRVERHEALPIPALVVFPPKGHPAVVTGQEPPIRDGHPMGIAGEVMQHRLRTGERGLGVG
jgi:hypothetical protein